MQREIKFRAWDASEKHMVYVPENDPDDWLLGILRGEQPEDVLLQFTGLRDKDGREVYDGDILEYQTKGESRTRNFVFWSDKKAGWCIGEKPDAEMSLWVTVKMHAVIGNIYENPELLK